MGTKLQALLIILACDPPSTVLVILLPEFTQLRTCLRFDQVALAGSCRGRRWPSWSKSLVSLV